jgi:hypothetical protein
VNQGYTNATAMPDTKIDSASKVSVRPTTF